MASLLRDNYYKDAEAKKAAKLASKKAKLDYGRPDLYNGIDRSFDSSLSASLDVYTVRAADLAAHMNAVLQEPQASTVPGSLTASYESEVFIGLSGGRACWCPFCRSAANSDPIVFLRRPDGTLARDWRGVPGPERWASRRDPRFLGLLRVGDRVRFHYSTGTNELPGFQYIILSIDASGISVRRDAPGVMITSRLTQNDINNMYPSGD